MLFSRSENSEFKMRRRNRKPIAAHPFFVPMLSIWGALLAGLTIMVLPAEMINQITTAAALGVLDNFARYFYATIAALIGAACGYFVATKWRAMLPGRSEDLMGRAAAHVRPIDPVAELGSESLDAPIEDDVPEEEPLELETLELETLAEQPGTADTSEEQHVDTDDTFELRAEFECEPSPEQEAEPEPAPVDPLEGMHCEPMEDSPEPASLLSVRRRRNRGKPVELVQALGDHRARQAALHKDLRDLGEFSQLAEHKRTTKAPKPAPKPTPAPTAIDKLRAVPPQDLSLVQMVERLAVALHERQEAARAKPQTEQATERDAALAEALKALSLFTEKGFASQPRPAENDQANIGSANEGANDGTEAELRDALSKLQTMRGAA